MVSIIPCYGLKMLTIIIPTLNAEATLPQTLEVLGAHDFKVLDILIVDGGSTDETHAIATHQGAKVIACEPGRGRQLALGADQTKSAWMLFLHADTILPKSWNEDLRRYTGNPTNSQSAAYFQLAFDDLSGGANRVAALANWRAKAWGLPYGDQGLLIHRNLYDEIGGYRESLKLMEDVDIAQRLGPMRLKALRSFATTSAQKYQHGGWWARPARNLLCLALFLAGAPQRWIETMYK